MAPKLRTQLYTAGKASTIFQVFMLYFVLFLNATVRSPLSLAWVYVLAALLAAASFAHYCVIGVRMLREGDVPPVV
jgi:cobalamin biosynthesis protein CobD/CbiB